MTPMVSVIIPSYNRAGILSRAIDSVLAQTFRNFELIVVDDGSSDETPEVLEGYRDRLKALTIRHGGVSAARNRGIKEAGGEFIALLDSDDSWLPEKLAVQTDFFIRNPSARICQTGEIWHRRGKRVNPGKRHQKPSGDIFYPSLKLCLVSPSTVMIGRDIFDDVGLFDESLPACEDYDLWLRISARFPVYLIDRALTIKTGGHADQLSRIVKSLDKYRIKSLLKLLQSGVLSSGQAEAVVAELARKANIYGQGCRKRGRTGEAGLYLELAEMAAEGAFADWLKKEIEL
ncbi:MAG: glycosyltransferase [Deltaproteobacteria bacterium]|nr:glycosyltransferase [Deltaproteobacteria bacterium]